MCFLECLRVEPSAPPPPPRLYSKDKRRGRRHAVTGNRRSCTFRKGLFFLFFFTLPVLNSHHCRTHYSLVLDSLHPLTAPRCNYKSGHFVVIGSQRAFCFCVNDFPPYGSSLDSDSSQIAPVCYFLMSRRSSTFLSLHPCQLFTVKKLSARGPGWERLVLIHTDVTASYTDGGDASSINIMRRH